ncbi:hypothetical protein FGG08_004257 [Glutinoglossum americanum]|uniref:Uncharacterized protein n=1 Tax=Glutinoglossum americanum TaxID=1670608 RepID=A0A9P8KX98_9PEZI|nr:hypothetical protein FGG08_004257 [Glutinoglossum americanum]
MEEISSVERIPARYIERRVSQTKTFQPIFGGGTIEFDDKSRVVMYREADRPKLHTNIGVTIDQQADSMKAAIRAYEVSSKEEYHVRWDLDKTGSFNIEKALQDISESTEVYLAKGRAKDGLKNRIRGCLRRFSDNTESLAFLLEFLPSDSYGSLIYGGVAVILKAASRLGHAREGVLEALTELPEILSSASIFDAMYKDSPRLKNAVSVLHVATLLALEHILSWFSKHAAKKAKFFESRKYDESLTAKIEDVRKCSDAVRKEADLCQQEIGLNTNKKLGELAIGLPEVILFSSENIKEHISATFANQAAALRSDILNDLYGLFINSPAMQLLIRQAQLQVESSKDITRDELLTRIDSPFAAIAKADIRTSLDAYLSFREQDRVQAIVQSPQLKFFFSSPDSTALLLEGNTGTHDTNSSISYFSATLVDSIRKLNLPVIHFICGLHRNSQPEDFNGPDGMMQALLRQLLAVNGRSYISLKKSTMEKLPQSDKAVRKTVRELLVRQRHQSVTFCIIDGISFFETARWEKRLKTALTSLMKAVNDPKGTGVVKLLITTPESSRCAPRIVGQERILSLQKDLIEGARQGFGEEQVKVSMKEAVGANWRRRSTSWR